MIIVKTFQYPLYSWRYYFTVKHKLKMPSKTSRARIKRIELGIINSKPEEEKKWNKTKLMPNVFYRYKHTPTYPYVHMHTYIESHFNIHVKIGVYMHVWKICICEGTRNQKVI